VLNDLSKGYALSYVSNLDSHTLTLFGLRDNDDEPTFDTSDSVTLFADIFDFDIALFALFNGWLLRTAFAL